MGSEMCIRDRILSTKETTRGSRKPENASFAKLNNPAAGKMSQNESSRIPTKLVPKSSGKLAVQEYLLRFKIGQVISTEGTTRGSRCPGNSGFVKIIHPATGTVSQNQFSRIPTKLVPKLSGELAAQEYAIHFENGE